MSRKGIEDKPRYVSSSRVHLAIKHNVNQAQDPLLRTGPNPVQMELLNMWTSTHTCPGSGLGSLGSGDP